MKFRLLTNIKVDKNVQKGEAKNELEVLLSLIRTTTLNELKHINAPTKMSWCVVVWWYEGVS